MNDLSDKLIEIIKEKDTKWSTKLLLNRFINICKIWRGF